MSEDLNSLVYRGVQRIFRNSFVRLLREKLVAAFPEDHGARLRKPFTADEWQGIEVAAKASRDLGALDAPLTDDFDLLSVNHFFNLADSYWSQLSQGLDASPKLKQSVLGWLREIKTLRDPLSHPAEAELSREDAFHALDCARRVLKSFKLPEADELRTVQQALFGMSSGPEPLDSKLPPRDAIVTDFVGRSEEMERLWEWLQDPVAKRWALCGEGGKGKSALAYSFAARVVTAAPPPYQTVIWLSAKKRHFVEGVTLPLQRPDFTGLSSALDALLEHFGFTEDLQLPIESRRARVYELLRNFPALLIVDDVDSLDAESEDAIEFFTLEVPQTRSKVLFTSRRVLFGLGNSTTHVSGFTMQEGERFVHSRCELMDLDPSQFSKAVLKELMKVTDGSPLYIEDLLRLTAAVASPTEAIKQWGARAGSNARQYALGRECDLLTLPAKKVLFAACVSEEPASFVELEAIAGLQAEAVTGALQELQRLFLVPKPRLIKNEQRFDVNLNIKTLVREVYGRTPAFREIEAAHRAVTRGTPLQGRGHIAGLVRQASLLIRGKRQEEAERLLLDALDKYPNDPDLVGALGWVYKAWQPVRLTDARERFKRAAQLKNLNEDTYKHWSDMEIREGEWLRAAEAAESGLKMMASSRVLLYCAGRARQRAARELLAGLHHGKSAAEAKTAKSLLLRALSSVEGTSRVTDSDLYRALVLTSELEADVASIRKYFAKWKTASPLDPDFDSEWERLKRKFKLEPLQAAEEAL